MLSNEGFLSAFDMIVLTDVDAPTVVSFVASAMSHGPPLTPTVRGHQLQVNALTRKLNKKLYVAASVGIDGWMFADLLEHEFLA